MVGGRLLLLFCLIEQNKSRRVDIDPLVLGDGLLYSPEPKTSGVQRVRTLWQDKRSNACITKWWKNRLDSADILLGQRKY